MDSVSVFIPVVVLREKLIPMSIKCIDKARKNTNISFELIIIENSPYPLLYDYADIFIHTQDFNDYAWNANTCLKIAHGDYIVSLGNDLFCPERWLENLLDVFKEKEDCGIATLNSSEHNLPARNEICEDFFGGIFMLKRDVFNKVGLLDETFKNSFEDADYWIRTYQAGYKIYKNMRVVIEHLTGQTWRESGDHQDNYIAGRKYFNEKHKDCGLELFERLK